MNEAISAIKNEIKVQQNARPSMQRLMASCI